MPGGLRREKAGTLSRASSGERRHPSAENGAPGRTRTCNPRVRSPILYPVELRMRDPSLTRVSLQRNCSNSHSAGRAWRMFSSCSHANDRSMRFAADQLRDKALLALEEVVQECRYRSPRRSAAIRFALAYLWATGRCDRERFDEYWEAIGKQKSPWSFSVADSALSAIYRGLGLERDKSLSTRLWRKREAEENARSKASE
jgi:hypothetical protein